MTHTGRVLLLRACHPLPAAAVTALSGALALSLGHRPGSAVLAAATVGASQLSIGWANDAIDARRDAQAGRMEKPLVGHPRARRMAAWAAGLAGVVTLLAALGWGWPRAAFAITALISAQLYNWPLKGTPLSFVPYLISFGALPLFLAPDAPRWLVAAAALVGASAHLVNVLPDLAADAATGVRGLPQRLGPRSSMLLAAGLLVAATATLVAGASPPLWAAAAVLAMSVGLLPLSAYADPRTTFRAVIVVAAADVLLIAGALL